MVHVVLMLLLPWRCSSVWGVGDALMHHKKHKFLLRRGGHPLSSQAAPAAAAALEIDEPTLWGRKSYTAEERQKQVEVARARQQEIKAAMQHAWKGYTSKAWGKDELLPASGRSNNKWGGIGMTMLDSLDTLWIMGMKDEFAQAKEWVSTKLDFSRVGEVSVFETTIRALGGLLGAYTLSQDKVFLDKARDLGDRLLKAFRGPQGLPFARIHLGSGAPGRAGGGGKFSSLAEVGSLQLELGYLSKLTNDPKYATTSNQVYALLGKLSPANGPVFSNEIKASGGGISFGGPKGFGAGGDSYYEYLLKCWVQSGGAQKEGLHSMYEQAISRMIGTQVHQSTRGSRMRYISDSTNTMEHLMCFVPGMLALGAHWQLQHQNINTAQATESDTNYTITEREVRDIKLAKELAYTCYQLYAQSETKLAAEAVSFNGGGGGEFKAKKPYQMWSVLRPETVESLFILHQFTGDSKYQDWGYEIFKAFERLKTTYGYGALPDVTSLSTPCCRGNDDKMESFVLAETFKYLYLLQDTGDAKTGEPIIDLNKYVMSTEAHPFPICVGCGGPELNFGVAAAAPVVRSQGIARCTFSSETDYDGADVTSAQVGDRDGCCQICANTPSCKFFSYRIADRYCFMKSANLGKKRNSAVEGGALVVA
jgi:mannosyl-oligosaccharide alpha-1,2-mannosidase